MAAVTLDSSRVHQGNETEHLIKLFLMVVLSFGSIFIGCIMMQMVAYGSYFLSIYNFVDLTSTVLPITYAFDVLSGSGERRCQYVGVSMFFLYVNLVSIHN